MNSMIGRYAIEGRDDDGNPNHQFYLDEEQARMASEEVAATHLHLQGQALKNYMDANFMDAWNYYNTANDGKIEADRMTTFFRFFTHDANLNIQ